jgi:hypothetical protein
MLTPSCPCTGVYPNGGTHRSPIRQQRDAFLDLEDEARLSASPQKRETVRRGSSFSEAQMLAASKGLARSSRASSNDGSDLGHSPVNEKRESDAQATLPTLPDTPSKSIPLLTVAGAQEAIQDGPEEGSNVSGVMKRLPKRKTSSRLPHSDSCPRRPQMHP